MQIVFTLLAIILGLAPVSHASNFHDVHCEDGIRKYQQEDVGDFLEAKVALLNLYPLYQKEIEALIKEGEALLVPWEGQGDALASLRFSCAERPYQHHCQTFAALSEKLYWHHKKVEQFSQRFDQDYAETRERYKSERKKICSKPPKTLG